MIPGWLAQVFAAHDSEMEELRQAERQRAQTAQAKKSHDQASLIYKDYARPQPLQQPARQTTDESTKAWCDFVNGLINSRWNAELEVLLSRRSSTDSSSLQKNWAKSSPSSAN